jgi:hypothetical protein
MTDVVETGSLIFAESCFLVSTTAETAAFAGL